MFRNKDSITSSQLTEALAPLLKRLDDLEAEIKTLKADNKSLKDKLSALEEDLAIIKKNSKPSSLDNTQQEDSGVNGCNGELKHIDPSPIGGGAVVATPPRGEAFLPSPTLSGIFLSSSSEEEIGKSIYKLTTDDGVHGKFSLLQTPDALATAMISVSQFLKPVCRITGDTHHMPEKIETIEEGEAKNEDGVWTVTKKAVLRFS